MEVIESRCFRLNGKPRLAPFIKCERGLPWACGIADQIIVNPAVAQPLSHNRFFGSALIVAVGNKSYN